MSLRAEVIEALERLEAQQRVKDGLGLGAAVVKSDSPIVDAASRWVRLDETGEVVEARKFGGQGVIIEAVSEPGRYLVVRIDGEET